MDQYPLDIRDTKVLALVGPLLDIAVMEPLPHVNIDWPVLLKHLPVLLLLVFGLFLLVLHLDFLSLAFTGLVDERIGKSSQVKCLVLVDEVLVDFSGLEIDE